MPKTYGTVATFTAGSVLTAAQMNTIGTAVNNLVVPAAARISRSASTAIPNNTNTAVAFSAGASYDTDGMFSAGSNTILTINTTGIYAITAYVTWASNATGVRFLTVQVNSANSTISLGMNPVSGFATEISISGTLNLSATNTVRLMAYQSSGADLNLTTAELSATWVARTS